MLYVLFQRITEISQPNDMYSTLYYAYFHVLVGPNDDVVKLYDLTSLSEAASCALSTPSGAKSAPPHSPHVSSSSSPEVHVLADAASRPEQQQPPPPPEPLDSETGERSARAPPVSSSPFTLPVAMLLFRVARSLHKESGARRARAVGRLARSALALLDPLLPSNSEVRLCLLLLLCCSGQWPVGSGSADLL